MAAAVARAMANEAPLLWLLTKDDPAIAAIRIAARPAEVNTIAVLARMARTRAPIAAPRSTSATTACTASTAEPKTVGRNDLWLGSVTEGLTPLPIPNS